MADLSVVIVSWNVRDLLRRCLASVEQGSGALALDVIVVDNASSDGSPEMVSTEFPHVRLITNRENRGFGSANNQGLAVSEGRHVVLLNPDTEILDGALSKMVAYVDSHPGIGALGPQLLHPDGTVQSSRRRFPTLTTAFLESTILQQWWPQNPVSRRYYIADRTDFETQYVDWLVGACLLVRRQVIEQVGGLDEGFFMYSEELDWCRRIKAAGWEVVYLPEARVVHFEGQSSGQVVAARHIYFHSSKVRYFRKHHGTLQAEVLRLFLLATFAYQLGSEGLKWLVGHKRPLRAERMAEYRQVLRSGLRAARP
jgi:N-acetylglucosaminyl-diphospho-decaprenol L-rhamnosyltransferase